MMRVCVLSILLLSWMGCASVKVEPVQPGANADGLRFFRPAPYLLVATTEAGQSGKPGQANRKVTYQLIWLPDYSKEYRIHHTGFIGSASLKVKLDSGWQLTELGIDRDTKAPDMVKEGTGLAKALGVAASAKNGEELGPGLYRLQYGADGNVESLEKVRVVPLRERK